MPRSTIRAAAVRYLASFRLSEILVLQGPPLMGAAVAIPRPGVEHVGPLALLVAASTCLVAHIFLLNDWCGLTADLADPHRASRVFTAKGVSRKEMGGLAVLMLALSLLFSPYLGPVPLGLTLAIAGFGALYSLPRLDWKGKPLLNSAAHLGGGTLHFLLGYSLGTAIDGRGLALATYFAVIFAAGHLTQELRDHDADLRNGIRTNAVVFGQRRTFLASLALFTLSHALLCLLALSGFVPRPLALLVVLYPLHLFWSLRTLREGLTYEGVRLLRARYRALYAVIGLAMLIALGIANGREREGGLTVPDQPPPHETASDRQSAKRIRLASDAVANPPTTPQDRACPPPEAVPGEMGDERASVYSVGAILDELVTGASVGPNMRSPSEIVPGLGRDVEVLLGNALISDPAHRPADLTALAQAGPGTLVVTAPILFGMLGPGWLGLREARTGKPEEKPAIVQALNEPTFDLMSMATPVVVVFSLAVAPVAFGLSCIGAWFGMGK